MSSHSASQVMAMFPGQGSQYVGMGKQLLDEFPYTKEIFEEAEDAAGIGIKKLCLDGPEDQLKLTANTQPCIVTVSVATWTVLKQERGIEAGFFAGHSLGEYSALVASTRIKLSDAVRLVRHRGLAMQKAVPEGKGAMSAVLSMEAPKLEAMCLNLSTDQDCVQVVNYNSPQQLVVAGSLNGVVGLEEKLKANGIKYIRLPVSAPFHSNLMAPARAEMTPLLERTAFSQASSYVIPNLTAELTKDYGPEYLIKQIDSPVRWIQTVEKAHMAGVKKFIEVGPGRVLGGLAKRILPKGDWSADSTDDVKAFLGIA
jgi:[acyl-carrier-protein] S-malonyltransferase